MGDETNTSNGITVTCPCGAKMTFRNDDCTYLNTNQELDGRGRSLIMEKMYDKFMKHHEGCLPYKAETKISQDVKVEVK